MVFRESRRNKERFTRKVGDNYKRNRANSTTKNRIYRI